MTAVSRQRWPWLVVVALLAGGLTVAAVGDRGPQTTSERARALAEDIKCPTCQGQSVADSDATAARTIRTEIARRLEQGQSDEQIRDYILSLYPDSSLTPPASGVGGLVWFLPVALFVGAAGGLAAAFRHWRAPPDREVSTEDRELVEEALRGDGS
ncbi:MAG: cytochrome c-type biogenesis protein [Acidimicrobiales bacterium]|nr:cytochrome c-type biogenesis protein [Acidimicrobiales bacterium]